MTRNEKLCGNLSMPLLEESNCSDAARSSSIDIGNSDCENRAKREIENQVVLKRQGGSWLATSHHEENAGTFSPPYCLVFVGQDRQ